MASDCKKRKNCANIPSKGSRRLMSPCVQLRTKRKASAEEVAASQALQNSLGLRRKSVMSDLSKSYGTN